ncbi:MAG: arginine Nomega-methyltransferase [Mycobacteriales bacterium]
MQAASESTLAGSNGIVADSSLSLQTAGEAHSVAALLTLGRAAIAQHDYSAAIGYLARAESLAGADDPIPGRLLNRVIRRLVPRWHFAMINDHRRNAAYEAAIAATVRPGDLVLDIGTGSGLLALLAAQAGAGLVISCEAEPVIADVARQIVAANGYQDRVRVVDGLSTNLRVGVDLPAPADVLVTEIFDCGLLGENVLPTVEHARRELLADGARILPGRARLWGQLVSSDNIRSHNYVSTACGFDVSTFNQFRSLEYFDTYLENYPHQALTSPFPLLDVDFNVDCPPAREVIKAVPAANGDCDAIAIWFELDLAPGVSLSTGPEQRGNHWRQAIQTFDVPFRCETGRPVALQVQHDRERVLVMADGDLAPPPARGTVDFMM